MFYLLATVNKFTPIACKLSSNNSLHYIIFQLLFKLKKCNGLQYVRRPQTVDLDCKAKETLAIPLIKPMTLSMKALSIDGRRKNIVKNITYQVFPNI